SAAVRERAGVRAGDDLDVEVELDTAPREVAVPDDLAAALRADSTARRAFEGLSFSGKQRLVLPIEQAKAAETRQRRVARAVEELRSAGG
ncbi:MAG: YdeI/OmpD-associated family protein, partial [Candidatus Dormibacteraeota bacterium]|nr:YdeI/OmpD-associated family protein [Candidatus Dormibacteraeota bacterium]